MNLIERALTVQAQAAKVGFDWDNAEPIFDKLQEEILELKEVLNHPKEMEKELGDCFFVLINLARKLNINPESALLSTIHKFEKRFAFIETELAKLGKTPAESNLEEMDKLWERSKAFDERAL